MYKLLVRPLFFFLDPETSHHLALKGFSILLNIPILGWLIKAFFSFEDDRLKVSKMGITFPNPVGLAAGFDKDGKYIEVLDALGFGFIEVGTVTPLPQSGNPKPRLFRLKQDEAIINRMGFNNAGVDALVERLTRLDRTKISAVIGGNIGKNKVTPNEEAHLDYVKCIEKLHPLVDYFVVNVSSPNTPGLRALQDRESLMKILGSIQDTDIQKKNPKPILLKIAPDLTQEAVSEICSLLNELGIEGMITTNTTISRSGLKTSHEKITAIGNGGLSGQPVFESSNAILHQVKNELDQSMTLIGVGGIHDEYSAKTKFSSGADLIQVYTGFIYEGPGLIKRLKKAVVG